MEYNLPILGLCGPSCSGKSTVASLLANKFNAKIFNLDSYWIKGLKEVIVNGYRSYERPYQYDGQKMWEDIKNFHEENPSVPVIAEGFLLFLYPNLVNKLELKIFLDVPHTTLIARRTERAKVIGKNILQGGRKLEIEQSWIANGIEEWIIWGAGQRDLNGVSIIPTNRPAKEVALLVEELWRSF